MGRLIDADALIEHMREYKKVYGVPMTNRDKQVVHFMIGHIKNLEPTAYDVEAVVAELEKRVNDNDRVADRLSGIESKKKIISWRARAEAFRKAEEIVRGKEQP